MLIARASARFANRLKLIQELTAKCRLTEQSYDAFLRAALASRRDLGV
jgi:hypothetical protein